MSSAGQSTLSETTWRDDRRHMVLPGNDACENHCLPRCPSHRYGGGAGRLAGRCHNRTSAVQAVSVSNPFHVALQARKQTHQLRIRHSHILPGRWRGCDVNLLTVRRVSQPAVQRARW